MITEKCCGIVMFRKNLGKTEFLIIRSRSQGIWAFPKGHVEPGESEEETAIREVFEETGLKAEIKAGFRETISYSPAKGKIKQVVFFIGQPLNSEIKTDMHEIDKAEWHTSIEINKLFKFEDIKSVLKKAEEFIGENQAVIM